MKIRNRIKGLKQVKASQLAQHPKNWRTHPEGQQNALRGILAEVGMVGAVLARQLPDKTWQIIDGHLRAKTAGDELVPVLVTDLSDDEVEKVLLSFDAIGDLAERDEENLAELLQNVTTENDALQALFDEMAGKELETEEEEEQAGGKTPEEVTVEEVYQVVVECRDEEDQRDVFEGMRAKGYRCRALTL